LDHLYSLAYNLLQWLVFDLKLPIKDFLSGKENGD